MEIEWAPARKPSAQKAWRNALHPIAVEMAAEARALAEQSTAALKAEAPQWFPDAESTVESIRSTEASIRLLAQVIAQGGDPRLAPLPAATVMAARSGVQRQVALAAVLRSYRIGHEMVWRWLFDRITARAADATEQAVALDLASGWLFAYIDAAVTQAERFYEAEREAWMRSAAAARADAIDAILAERERNQRRAATRLRYELNRHHLGFRIALGDPAQGLDGFRRTHIEATHARRVVTLAEPHAAPVTRYQDVAVAALSTVDAEQAHAFVTRVLGRLTADDETTFRVAMTLARYLAENRSRTRTAERLMIHPNTVAYRVNQAEQILGRSIDRDTLDLRVALALLPTLRGLTQA
ncbi:PucR family transcriptional regulator [Streptosporangium sp. CA-135522]|uniref:PucR family transcriptional regulator n=1 Tax=Streptosporangium sp. CA-135522 TaxID=3240072 RepID=UPI003D8FED7C